MILNPELKKQSDKILSLIETAETIFEEDDEMRSHFAKYVCVLCSGFLENSIHALYVEYIKRETTSNPIISFSIATLHKIQNPRADKFREIAKSFNAAWEEPLKSFMMVDDRASAINYIMADRHKIAHGKDSDITLSRIKQHHLKTLEIINYIEGQCGLAINPTNT